MATEVESALAVGTSAYFFVGLVLALWWSLDLARHPVHGKEMDTWTLVQGVFLLMVIWPYMVALFFDGEDRWKR